MPKSNAQSVATRVVAKPIRIRFKLKSGRTISIKAIRTVEQKKVVAPRASKK